MAKLTESEYRKWLVGMVNSWFIPDRSYRELLNYLYSVPFYSIVRNDIYREDDAKDLRLSYSESKSDATYKDAYLYLNGQCNVLEIMAALAIRCESYIMLDPDGIEKPGRWFSKMLDSLNLSYMVDGYFDKRVAEIVIENFLERKFSKNGSGSLFTIKSDKVDMRTTEIWYQMMAFLNEVIYGEIPG